VNTRLALWSALVLGVAALGYAGRATGGKPPRDALFLWSTALSESVLFTVILGLVVAIAAGLPTREAFALRPPKSWAAAARIAVVTFVAVYVVTAVVTPFLHPGREQGLTPSGWDGSRAGQFAANAAVFVVVGPLVEELTFRGLGFALLERFGRPVAVVLVGIAFGVWHGLIDALPVLIAFGTLLAYLRSRSGSLYPGLILHATFNGIAIGAAILVS
jgi:membrane protease YdiL (CAAX protease family)